VRRALLILLPAVAAATLAACGGGDDEAGAASRSRVFEDGEVASDVALSDGFLSVWTPEAGQVVSPARGRRRATAGSSRPRPGRPSTSCWRAPPARSSPPARGALPAGRGVRPPGGAAGARRPGEARRPQAGRVPPQRFVVTGFREYPANEQAMEVFDLPAVDDGAGAATTGTPTAP
jgi:hypothetical protein